MIPFSPQHFSLHFLEKGILLHSHSTMIYFMYFIQIVLNCPHLLSFIGHPPTPTPQSTLTIQAHLFYLIVMSLYSSLIWNSFSVFVFPEFNIFEEYRSFVCYNKCPSICVCPIFNCDQNQIMHFCYKYSRSDLVSFSSASCPRVCVLSLPVAGEVNFGPSCEGGSVRVLTVSSGVAASLDGWRETGRIYVSPSGGKVIFSCRFLNSPLSLF